MLVVSVLLLAGRRQGPLLAVAPNRATTPQQQAADASQCQPVSATRPPQTARQPAAALSLKMEAPRLLAPQPLLPLLLLLLGLASATGGAWRPEDSDGTQCLGVAGSNGNSTTCLPSWMATWDMKRSTVLYTCNNTGMHNVTHAVDYGTVVYDWCA